MEFPLTIPRWVALIGVLEIVLAVATLVAFGVAVPNLSPDWRSRIGLAGALALSAASLWAGLLLARRSPRGLAPSLVVLASQSIHLITPFFGWVVSSSLSALLVLYAAPNAPSTGGEILLAWPGHGRPTYLALNMLTLVPALALALWWRMAIVAARGEGHGAPAP